jgi:hypothetical protein
VLSHSLVDSCPIQRRGFNALALYKRASGVAQSIKAQTTDESELQGFVQQAKDVLEVFVTFFDTVQRHLGDDRLLYSLQVLL